MKKGKHKNKYKKVNPFEKLREAKCPYCKQIFKTKSSFTGRTLLYKYCPKHVYLQKQNKEPTKVEM